VSKKKHPEGKKKNMEKEEMQKKLRKENLPFVLASADRGSSWQPPIGRTLELGLRRSVTSLLPHAGVLRTQGRGFARLLRCCIQSIDFLDLLPSIFLAYFARTLFLANQRIFGTHLLFSFFGLVGFAWRERERELSRAREILCAGKKQEGEFFVSSSCNICTRVFFFNSFFFSFFIKIWITS
jgi:hypothetical protein